MAIDELIRTISLPPALLRRLHGQMTEKVAFEPLPSVPYRDLREGKGGWMTVRITEPAERILRVWLPQMERIAGTPSAAELSAAIIEGRLAYAERDAKAISGSASEIIQRQWMQALHGYPLWIVRRAFQHHRETNPHPPRHAEIRALCDKLWPVRRTMGRVMHVLGRLDQCGKMRRQK